MQAVFESEFASKSPSSIQFNPVKLDLTTNCSTHWFSEGCPWLDIARMDLGDWKDNCIQWLALAVLSAHQAEDDPIVESKALHLSLLNEIVESSRIASTQSQKTFTWSNNHTREKHNLYLWSLPWSTVLLILNLAISHKVMPIFISSFIFMNLWPPNLFGEVSGRKIKFFSFWIRTSRDEQPGILKKYRSMKIK